MSQYFFLLGNTPPLSLAELTALIPNSEIKPIASDVATVELPDDETARQIMDLSGGTVKVVRVIKTLEKSQPEFVEQEIVSYLQNHLRQTGADKATFGVGEIGRDHLEPLATSSLKHHLIKAGYKARYVEGTREGLSASILLHKKSVIEVVIIQTEVGLFLTQTIAVQDIDRWTMRDRGKPYADRRKGMLPPKVARMMVNIALGHATTIEKVPILYDPFCGTGTVLIEGILRDGHVLGSDSDPQAVVGTRQNLSWLLDNLEDVTIQSKTQVFQGDVTTVTPPQANGLAPVDCIVTEPFLGRPQPYPNQVPNIIKGLSKLYLGAFKNWTRWLKNDGIVVMVWPLIQAGHQVFTLESLIDKLVPLGYTSLSQPIVYSRPQAITQRQLFVFRFKKPTT